MEAALILADVAQRYQLGLAKPNDGQLTYVGVARPRQPIMMKVTPC
jgi:cytochrome P450